MYPTRGVLAGCCARAASGHATAAPPSAANNSRRPMMTVIRPSRARCVNGTIPRHERAVLHTGGAGEAHAGHMQRGIARPTTFAFLSQKIAHAAPAPREWPQAFTKVCGIICPSRIVQEYPMAPRANWKGY